MPRHKSHHYQQDSIRIVRLATPELIGRAATAAKAAHLIYGNGPLLANVEVFTIFWGSGWQQGPSIDVIPEVNAFFDFVLTSDAIDQLAEYSTPRFKIGHGKRTGTLTLTTPDVPNSVDDPAIQQMIEQQITIGKVPKSNANSLYFVFLPSGVTVTQGGHASCQAFCGYHDATSNQVFYAVMPFPDCSGCSSTLSVFDALTATVSHELCEAITDPIPGQGWYDISNGEIGDICAWQTRKIGKYTVQKEWSNKAGSCV